MKLLGKKIYRVALKPQKNGLGAHNRDSEGNYKTSGTRSGCCVHPDTRISMADGTTKAAKDVRIGDELITQAGTGKVQIITNPELGYRSLYSYGRGSYFITGDHPIHADGEWKSLMPGFSKLDYGVECTRLEKGAVLTLINGDKVKLEKIKGETNNPNLVLYDFHMDGDEDANHTYFANGLLVHNGGGGGGGGGGGCGSSRSSSQGYYDDTGAYNYGTDYSPGGQYYEAPDPTPAPTPTPTPAPAPDPAPEEIVGGGDGAGVEDAFDVEETGGDPQDEAENMGGTVTEPDDTTTGSTPQDQTTEIQEDDSYFGQLAEDTTQQDLYDQDDLDFQDSLDVAIENTQDIDDGSTVETDTFDEDFSFDSDFDDDSVIDPTKPDQIDVSGQTGDQVDSQTLTGENIDDSASGFYDSLEDVSSDDQDNYDNYVMDLQEMFDDPDQRPSLTVNELNTLREEGYITGDPEDTVQSGQGQAGDITDVTHTPTSDLASTLDKVQAGVPLGQTDYENIQQKPLPDRLDIYQQISTGTLEDALDFSNLTNTSVVPYLTEENVELMGQTGDGLDTLSWEDKKELMGPDGSLILSASVLFDMDPAQRKDYFDLKFGYDEKGLASPDPTVDPQGYKNYIKLQNDMIAQAMENDPTFMDARVNAWAEHLGDKGLNVGKGVLMKMARAMLSAQMRDIVGGATGGMMLAAGASPLMGMAAGMVTSKIYAKFNKEAQKKFQQQAQQMGLTPQQAIQVNDSLADWEASPAGQQYIDNFVQSDNFQQQLFQNHALSQGFVYDPNALNGEGAYTAIYGYNEDGIPLTRPEAINTYGQGHVNNIEQGYQNSGINFTYTGTSGEQLDDAGSSFSDDSLGQPLTSDDSGDVGQKPVIDSGGSFEEEEEDEIVIDETPVGEGDDDMTPPTSGGSSNERWERFMEMMEKRARGEAPSLTEEAMRKEREEGLKERMAVMAMGRGQPTSAGLRQYDRAKGTADAELARDAALTRLKEQRLAQEQYGQALTDQMDRESREKMGTEKLSMDKELKQMDAQTAKDKGWFNFWKELGAGAFMRYGNKIDDWIAAGWDKLTAEEQIKANGDEPADSGGDDGQGWGGGDSGQGFQRPPDYPGSTANEDLPSGMDEHGTWVYNTILDVWEFKLWDEPFHDGGKVEGPGSETSDDIPALLSDGEFVINARTVRGLGRSQGANNKKEERERGVQFLEQLQKDFGEKDEVSFGDVLIARRGL